MKLKVEIEGIRPLLQHRYNIEKGEAKSKKQIGSPDYKKEAEESLYRDEQGTIYEPADHILGAMIKSAANFKIPGKNKKTYKDMVKGFVFIDPDAIPLISKKKWEIDARPVVIQRARIMRYRPKFNDWKLSFIIDINSNEFPKEVVKEILDYAGNSIGIGDYRPRFGRFIITKFEEIK
jgi:hypothetical protein